MSDVTTPTVGKLLNGSEGRDAIHFALAPVVVGGIEGIPPGGRVILAEGRTDTILPAQEGEEPIGIADPFLDLEWIRPGQRCWLFLMPNTITGLRHVWTHPAFAPAKAPEVKV